MYTKLHMIIAPLCFLTET
ncbi:hypothetical protein CAEBREN_14849 [Caenorhabditis brenneri]|uniref:Uncharacterized protein n=1 Tax=Caenorhabditis brenneri TaxID=135651 RepID=G0NV63_CAEBE|nr:hypothetical protein CAEBREN_14849 [Caenorhabditis brenneri]